MRLRSPALLAPGVGAVLLAFAAASPAHAQFVSTPAPAAASAGTPESNLVIDDGTHELVVGLTTGGQFLWFNQFTPPVEDFPMSIEEVQVLFTPTGEIALGDSFDVYVYYSDQPSPSLGATLIGYRRGMTVDVLEEFQAVPFETPIAVPVSGDILLAIVSRAGMDGETESPAAMDQSTSLGRSWFAVWESGPPEEPEIPGPLMGRAEDAGLFGNWLIRGTYRTNPVGTGEGPPRQGVLAPVAPNPTAGVAVVPFTTRASGPVRLVVLDPLGREVLRLVDGDLSAGEHRIPVDVRALPAGVYRARLHADGVSSVQSVTVVR